MNHKVALNSQDAQLQRVPLHHNAILVDQGLHSCRGVTLEQVDALYTQQAAPFGLGGQVIHSNAPLAKRSLGPAKELLAFRQAKSEASILRADPDELTRSRVRHGLVSDIRLLSADTAILRVDISMHPEFNFHPGQHLYVHVPGSAAKRPLSLACSPTAKQLTFLIQLQPKGEMSRYLRERCIVGDRIGFDAPTGSFYMRPIKRPVIMIAEGAGLSPFLGMLDQLVENGGSKHPIHLYYGVQKLTDLCELQRIQSYSKNLPHFRFTPVVSGEDQTWIGKKGSLRSHLDIDHIGSGSADIYVCGSKQMTDSMSEWMANIPLPKSSIYVESHDRIGA